MKNIYILEFTPQESYSTEKLSAHITFRGARRALRQEVRSEIEQSWAEDFKDGSWREKKKIVQLEHDNYSIEAVQLED